MDREPNDSARDEAIDRILAAIGRPIDGVQRKPRTSDSQVTIIDDVEIYGEHGSGKAWRPLIDILPVSPTRH